MKMSSRHTPVKYKHSSKRCRSQSASKVSSLVDHIRDLHSNSNHPSEIKLLNSKTSNTNGLIQKSEQKVECI